MDDAVVATYRGIVLIVFVLLLVLAAVVVLGLRRRTRTARDDTRRVGDDAAVDSREAARRAQGRSAWTRISGGF